jgi:hypothetical protein
MLMDWLNQQSKNGYTTKAIYMFKAIPIQISMTFITKIEKIYATVHLETEKTANSQAIQSKQNNAGGITTSKYTIDP